MKHSVEEVKLSNGVRGLLINTPGSDIIRPQVWFNSGFRFSDRRKFEMPHITEHLVLGANEEYPDSIIFKQEIEKNGAHFNGWTNWLFNSYEWECASFEIKRILALAEPELTKPLINSKDVVTEKNRAAEELSGYISDHYRTLYDNATYRFEGTPTHKTRLRQLKTISARDMRAYYERTHTTQNAVVFAAGDIARNKDSLLSGFESITSGLPKGEVLRAGPMAKRKLSVPVFEFRDIPQIHYRLSFSTGPTTKTEWAAASILTTLLNSFLPSSLFGAVWKRGLAYGIYSGFSFDHTETAFHITDRVSVDHSLPLFELVAKQVKAIKQGKVTTREIGEAKDISLGTSKRRYQTPGSLLDFYAEDYMIFGETIGLNEWEDLKSRVSAADVEAIAAKLTQGNPWVLSLVGPVKQGLADRLYKISSQLAQ